MEIVPAACDLTGPVAVGPDIGTVKAYTQAKQAIAREIRLLRSFFQKKSRGEDASACQELLVKLAEDRFVLAVLGQFKRGKSSLMNAIIGRDLLPCGVLPLTSAITTLRFGPREKLVIERDRALFPVAVSLDQLADYVTERGNPGNRKQVRVARIEVPLAFLRQGLEFVDTPGIGSAIEANTATTYEFLPRCDAALFVTSADAPMTRTEIEFLDRIRVQVRKIFLVVNKTDLLRDVERDQVMDYIATVLRQHGDEDLLPLYPVSSRRGLEAKRAGDRVGYARSGLKELEETLAVALSSGKASTFLVAVVDKALRLLHGRDVSSESRQGSAGTFPANRLASLQQRLQSEEWIEPPAEEQTVLPQETSRATAASSPEESPEVLRESNLAVDLRTRGCPVCNYLQTSAFDFFARWQYALSSESSLQDIFVAELGFCPLHTWHLVGLASPRGLAVGYPPLLERVARELAHLARTQEAAAERLRSRVLDLRSCRACHFLHQAEQVYVQRLARFIAEGEGLRAYAGSQGVCLPHLALLLAASPEKAASFLLAEAARHFEECAEEMRSYALKYDALRRTLLNTDEEDAYVRAIVHLVGERSLALPAGEEVEI